MERDSNTITIIISDLHLGKNDDFDIFRSTRGNPHFKEELFEKFITFCSASNQPVELVINGDFVDFLQLRPWDLYDSADTKEAHDQAVGKAREIAAAHPDVLQALRRLIEKPKNRIVVLLGNHDVELAYNDVWQVIQEAILGSSQPSGQLVIINRQTQYNPTIGGVLLHIEHGNIGDPWNEIDYRRLFNHAEKGTGFSYPQGTRFVYEVMNKFKERFHFVDLLKPEVPAVPLLLARLAPLRAAKLLPLASLNFIREIKDGFLNRIRQAVGGGAFGSLKAAASDEKPDPYAAMALSYLAEASGGQPEKFGDLDANALESFLNEEELDVSHPSAPMFGPRWDRVKNYMGNAILKKVSGPSRRAPEFYQKDGTGDDVKRAREQLKGRVRIVAFGHTHGALKTEFSDGCLYLNSGAWANLISLSTDSTQFSSWFQSIANDTFERTSFPTYIRIRPSGGAVAVSLSHWSEDGEKELWSKNITV